jgi:hypothetical protein
MPAPGERSEKQGKSHSADGNLGDAGQTREDRHTQPGTRTMDRAILPERDETNGKETVAANAATFYVPLLPGFAEARPLAR